MPKKRKKLLWQLYPPFLAVTLLAVFGVAWFSTSAFYDYYVTTAIQRLRSQAALLETTFKDKLDTYYTGEVDRLAKELAAAASSGAADQSEQLGTLRITVVLRNGTVIGDSNVDTADMPNIFSTEEIEKALEADFGTAQRIDPATGESAFFVAKSIRDSEGDLLGFVRCSSLTEQVNQEIRKIYLEIALAVLLTAVLAAFVCMMVARNISGPLQRLKRGAERFSEGDLDFHIPEEGTLETAGLASSMNDMASHLRDRIRVIVEQRNEIEAMLSSMVEGVLAFDNKKKLVKLNSAAAKLLDLDPDFAIGKSIDEIMRNRKLREFVRETYESSETLQREFKMQDITERSLRASGTMLEEQYGTGIRAVVVLNDVTQIRRLENLRKDFVANVTHELKTPVTSIKGFCENLQDGAIEDPELTRKFVDIIAKQTERLISIINDLLSLSRIETFAGGKGIFKKLSPVLPIIDAACQVCEYRAQQKDIDIHVNCHGEPEIPMNGSLVEQAVVNLLDNAVKYSENGHFVEVDIYEDEGELIISVTDQGIGISEDHLERIFERFYRVDKARSRKLGGTGLGLAIVKHIAIVHDGRVTVKSQPGVGSTFRLHLPTEPILST